jgi:hypothetical protein
MSCAFVQNETNKDWILRYAETAADEEVEPMDETGKSDEELDPVKFHNDKNCIIYVPVFLGASFKCHGDRIVNVSICLSRTCLFIQMFRFQFSCQMFY